MRIAKWVSRPCPCCGHPQRVLNGAWLRQQRVRAGVSQKDFAKLAGMPASFVCNIENGKKLPSSRAITSYSNLPRGRR